MPVPFRYFLLFLAAFVVTLIGGCEYYTAYAHDGYEDLKSPSGFPCCGGQDCGPVEARTNAKTGHIQVHIVGPPWSNDWFKMDEWLDVPDEAVLPPELNPKLGPSACVIGHQVRCFMWGKAT